MSWSPVYECVVVIIPYLTSVKDGAATDHGLRGTRSHDKFAQRKVLRGAGSCDWDFGCYLWPAGDYIRRVAVTCGTI